MALRWYQAKLASRPILTQSITTAILFGTGDTLAQHAVEQRALDDHDYKRTGRMALYGGAVFGPAATLWFSWLQRTIKIPNRPRLEIAAKVVTDQTVFASANLGCFLSSMAIMEGGSAKEKLKSTWLDAYKKNLMVWPAVQTANFSIVPLEHRVLVVNVVALGEFLFHFTCSGGFRVLKRKTSWGRKVLSGANEAMSRMELLPQLPEQQRRLRPEELEKEEPGYN